MSKVGGGGEYETQLGFGWTNGVVLDFLDMYHDRLSTKSFSDVDLDNIPTITHGS